MTWLIVLAVIVAVIVAIGLIRLGINAKYDGSFALSVKVAFKTIAILPRPEKQPGAKKPEKAAKQEKPKPEKPKAEKKNPLDMFGGLRGAIDFGLGALADFFEMVYTDRLVVEFVSAKKDDPAAVATNYGYACAAAGIITPLLENNRNVKYYSLRLSMDYEAEKPRIAGEIKLSVSIGRLVRFATSKGVKLLILLIKNGKKGGADSGKANIEYA